MLTHRHTWSLLLALLALTCYVTPSAAAEGKNEDKNDASGLPVYRSSVSEVRVTFFATDENNRPLETLSKSDFAVVDSERVVRNFRSFTHSDETSLGVVVLVDLSESVASRVQAAISDVLQLVAREQSIADDNISVLSFGGTLGGAPAETSRQMSAAIRPAVLCSSGCRASDSVAKLQAIGTKSGGSTPLFDALIFAADFLSNHHRGGGRGKGDVNVRPVLILFSDGFDTISMHSAGEAVQAAQDAGAVIYSVDMGASGRQTSTQTAGGVILRQLSEATGGRYFSSFSNSRFALNGRAASLLNTVLEDLRASYMVTYDLPSHQAGFHSLRLMPTHNLNLIFHSRDGYHYEPGGD